MQNFIKTIINAVQFWTNKQIKDSTADFSQNDSSADNYVKNRTHWEEEKVATIIPEQTINGFALMEEPIYCVVDAFSMEPVIGKTYTVTWDGASYDAVAQEADGMAYIGNNNYLYMQSGGDVPFAIIFGGGIFVATESTAESHTISITISETVVHKINEKYLPELISTPDWNQNNPEEKDYIKNRPFYEEVEYITYIEEQTVTFEGDSDSCEVRIENVNMPWDWVPYKVTFDGVEYEGTMYDNADDAWIPITLSDGARMNVYRWGLIYINSADYAGNHTIKVEQKVNTVHTIDSKYLDVPVYSGEGENSICINSSENIAGYYSHAEGQNTTASGDCSHAEGQNTTASGDCSHAEGQSTTASGRYSHAEGQSTTASGRYSHAEGQSTTAVSCYQHVSGKYNIPEDKYILKKENCSSSSSTFVGNGSSLYYAKNYSFDAETGIFTLIEPQLVGKQNGVSSKFETVGLCYMIDGGSSGNTMYYNTSEYAHKNSDKIYLSQGEGIKYTSVYSATYGGKYISIVGNGTYNARSNAHTLDWDGNAWFAGDVYVGGTSQDDATALGQAINTLSTEKVSKSGDTMSGWLDFGNQTHGLKWTTADGTAIHLRPYTDGNLFQLTMQNSTTGVAEYGVVNIKTNGDIEFNNPSQVRKNIGAVTLEEVVSALPTWTGGSY